jgi:hypothetical protein
MTNALHSAQSVEQYTPALIVEAARSALGGRIAFDPASCEFANRVVKAERYLAADGLTSSWSGPLFVNPPGKGPTNPKGQAAWWDKLMRERQPSWDAIFLGFSLELLQTAQSYNCAQPLSFSVCIPKRRIKFDKRVGDERVAGKNPTHGNIIICVTNDPLTYWRFRRAFSPIGFVSKGGF